MKWRSYLWTAAFVCGLSSSRAQTTTGVAFRYTVDPPSASVLQDREIHVFITGNSPDINLTEAHLTPSVEMRRLRPDLKTGLPCNNCSDANIKEVEIHLHEQNQEKELIFTYPSARWWEPLSNFALTQVEPGMQAFEFAANVSTPDPKFSPPPLRQKIEFRVTTPTIVVTLAGAAGALTLALLRLLYRLRPWHPANPAGELRELVLAVAAGGLIAFVLTYLGGLLSDAQLGVEITVTSWKGGFIIGLFSYKIADILAQKLWGAPKP